MVFALSDMIVIFTSVNSSSSSERAVEGTLTTDDGGGTRTRPNAAEKKRWTMASIVCHVVQFRFELCIPSLRRAIRLD